MLKKVYSLYSAFYPSLHFTLSLQSAFYSQSAVCILHSVCILKNQPMAYLCINIYHWRLSLITHSYYKTYLSAIIQLSELTWKHTLCEHTLCHENNMDNKKIVLRKNSVAWDVRVNLNYSTELHFTLVHWFKSRTWHSKLNCACAKVTWKPGNNKHGG